MLNIILKSACRPQHLTAIALIAKTNSYIFTPIDGDTSLEIFHYFSIVFIRTTVADKSLSALRSYETGNPYLLSYFIVLIFLETRKLLFLSSFLSLDFKSVYFIE